MIRIDSRIELVGKNDFLEVLNMESFSSELLEILKLEEEILVIANEKYLMSIASQNVLIVIQTNLTWLCGSLNTMKDKLSQESDITYFDYTIILLSGLNLKIT